MSNRGRAYRFHQRGRAQGRARRLVHGIWRIHANPGASWDDCPELVEKFVRRVSVDRKCEDWKMRWSDERWGERLDEQRAALNEKEQT